MYRTHRWHRLLEAVGRQLDASRSVGMGNIAYLVLALGGDNGD